MRFALLRDAPNTRARYIVRPVDRDGRVDTATTTAGTWLPTSRTTASVVWTTADQRQRQVITLAQAATGFVAQPSVDAKAPVFRVARTTCKR
jgi:hypothetical protein